MNESDRDRLLMLAHAVAPELGERPFYIVAAAELGIRPTAAGCGGMAGPALDLVCRDAIGDRWRGRGWCILLGSVVDPEGTMLHELTHILDGTMPWIELTAAKPEQVAAVVREDIRQDFTDCTAVRIALAKHDPWHGIEFHRALIHVRYRALQLGECICWRDLSPQSLCPMYQLAESLGSEPARCMGKSFTNIMARPEPRSFRKLWNRRHVAAEGSRHVAA